MINILSLSTVKMSLKIIDYYHYYDIIIIEGGGNQLYLLDIFTLCIEII